MRSFPFFADLSEKHGGPESNIKASWAMKFFSVILASYQEILSHPLSSQWTDCRKGTSQQHCPGVGGLLEPESEVLTDDHGNAVSLNSKLQ